MSRIRVAAFAAFLLVGGVAVWCGFRNNGKSAVDVDGAVAANNRGVGWMEQFRYEDAVGAFRLAVAKHPTWTAARINLAMASSTSRLRQPSEVIEILTQVLRDEPDEPHAHYVLGWLYKFKTDLAAAYPHFDAVTRFDRTTPIAGR